MEPVRLDQVTIAHASFGDDGWTVTVTALWVGERMSATRSFGSFKSSLEAAMQALALQAMQGDE